MHINAAKTLWDKNRWANFSPEEFACPCCGEIYWAPDYFDSAQQLREELARPVKFNSTHRCPLHNARVGGAPKSQHKKIALDFSLRGVGDNELPDLQNKMLRAGFRTFGLYRTFIHIDKRLGRFWVVGNAAKKWLPYFRRAT